MTKFDNYYIEAIEFAKSHYENFPILSIFIPQKLQKHVAIIYQFARMADDIADEGDFLPEERLKKLEEFENQLIDALNGKFNNIFWETLKNTIDTNQLETDNFLKLLTAFKQDITKKRYKNYDELLKYCTNSADPIGRLILELNDIKSPNALKFSDKICTALQITNFLQDVKIDLEKDRIYLPLDEIKLFNLDEGDILKYSYCDDFINLIKFQIDRTRILFNEGKQLLDYLPFKLRIQISTTIKGGEKILKKIEEIDYNVFKIRPRLTKLELIKLFISSLIIGK